jgi:hypothetical protein
MPYFTEWQVRDRGAECQRRNRARYANFRKDWFDNELRSRTPGKWGTVFSYSVVINTEANLTERQKRQRWLGTFEREIDAAKTWDEAAREFYGEDEQGYLNFPGQGVSECSDLGCG